MTEEKCIYIGKASNVENDQLYDQERLIITDQRLLYFREGIAPKLKEAAEDLAENTEETERDTGEFQELEDDIEEGTESVSEEAAEGTEEEFEETVEDTEEETEEKSEEAIEDTEEGTESVSEEAAEGTEEEFEETVEDTEEETEEKSEEAIEDTEEEFEETPEDIEELTDEKEESVETAENTEEIIENLEEIPAVLGEGDLSIPLSEIQQVARRNIGMGQLVLVVTKNDGQAVKFYIDQYKPWEEAFQKAGVNAVHGEDIPALQGQPQGEPERVSFLNVGVGIASIIMGFSIPLVGAILGVVAIVMTVKKSKKKPPVRRPFLGFLLGIAGLLFSVVRYIMIVMEIARAFGRI